MEFSADEGTVPLPAWLMRNVDLAQGDLVQVSNASLGKAAFVKLRPHETAFFDTTDSKAALEDCRRKFSRLTIGDTITVDNLCRKFSMDFMEINPENEEAVSVIETDCEMDFAAPLDHEEPEKREEATPVKFRAFTGKGRRLDGGVVQPPSTGSVQNDDDPMCCESSNESKQRQRGDEVKSFKPFTGKSYTLM